MTIQEKQFWDMTKQAPIVERAAQFVKRGKALDLGAGTGVNAFYLADKGFDVTAVDNDHDAISGLTARNDAIEKPIEIIEENILDYAAHEPFDYITCNMVLHFLKDKEQVQAMIQKLQDFTRVGGVNVLSAYTDKNDPGKRPYLFKTNELQEYYDGWDILLYDESPTMWFQMPGEDAPRRNHAVYLIARKNESQGIAGDGDRSFLASFPSS